MSAPNDTPFAACREYVARKVATAPADFFLNPPRLEKQSQFSRAGPQSIP